MKVVILAGGYGTRISEESHLKPKPMIEIGGKPIIWHIMKHFSAYGHTEFIICAGYKQYYIKEYFVNYFLHNSDITIDLTKKDNITVHSNFSEPWKVTIVDTGLDTMTGGRIKRIKEYIKDETFLITYGDGVSDVNISELVNFHNKNRKKVTITSIKPEGRFGILETTNAGLITAFREKNKNDVGWINGGYMVSEPDFLNYINDDSTVLEKEPFEKLVLEKDIMVFKHTGYWQCMDTLRDKLKLEELWLNNKAPWKVW